MYIIAAWPHGFLNDQLRTVVLWTTVAIMGNRQLGFDTGEGAWYTATTAKVGSRHNKGLLKCIELLRLGRAQATQNRQKSSQSLDQEAVSDR